ncbi:Dolichyl-phosphate-mannose-protein mannosyltransferase [Enhygromyxa salina]|uniref:Dolichyl-phosphate-mannose-protein mannosyltransferase n=1 Tax=Enhygromyxa salina TaxID=215803 RepID=A0A2S9XKM1_9BACT|nr:Dolichyl-phosphate-mannose-protein mannosyltransferase [Enhygromyxa salina]
MLAALLVLFSLLRLWKLELDPPGLVVPGYSGQAHFRDEAAKAHEARNYAKWQRWSLSEVDEYGFWRAQSPAWVWGEYLWFRSFGVGLLQARMFVVVQTIVALALLMWLAMIRHGLPAALATGLLLGLNWAYLVYSRLALMEGALICWLIVATVALSQLERQPRQAGRWSMLAAGAMLIACTIKQTGLLVVPAFSVALCLLGLRAAGVVAGLDDADAPWRARLMARLRQREARVTLVAVGTLGLALALLVFSPEYQQRLAFNAVHFTAAGDQSVLGRAAQTLARGFFSARLQRMFLLLAPWIMWLATLELVRVVVLALRDRRARKRGEPRPEPRGLLEGRADPIDLWMLAWAIFALLANLASPHRAIRFQLVMLPPAAWLAGAVIGRAWLHRWPSPSWRRVVRGSLVILALLGITLTAVRFVTWTRNAEASTAWIGDELRELIGEREAVVVGEFAAQAVFETDYRHFYVRPNQFNFTPEILYELGITHLVSEGEDDFVEELLQDAVPELLLGRRRLGYVGFRGRQLAVWELASPERRAEVEAWMAGEAEREELSRKAKRGRASKEQRAKASKRRRMERSEAQCLPEPLPEPEAVPMTKLPAPRLRGQPARGRPSAPSLPR